MAACSSLAALSRRRALGERTCASGGLGDVVGTARMDRGVEIELDLDTTRRGLAHAVVGKVLNPRQGERGVDEGDFVYVKSALTPADPEDLHAFRRSHPTFPHETTVDRFFDGAQFESYR